MITAPPPLPSVSTQRCGLAVWSLVLGIVSLLLCIFGPLFGIPAVICGHKAMGKIKRSGGAMNGNGLALAGLITGYMSIALIPVIGLLSAIAIPNFVKAREKAQTSLCINNMRQIDNAKEQWALEHAKTSDARPTVDDLKVYLHQDSTVMVCPAGGTYTIGAMSELPACSIPTHRLEP